MVVRFRVIMYQMGCWERFKNTLFIINTIIKMLPILLFIVSYDLWNYFVHRLLHTKYLYPYHKLHHQTLETKWQDTFRASLLENSVSCIGSIFPIFFIQYTWFDLIIANIVCFVKGVAYHDPRFAFSDHHLQHHKKGIGNYGEYWIDLVFQTKLNTI